MNFLSTSILVNVYTKPLQIQADRQTFRVSLTPRLCTFLAVLVAEAMAASIFFDARDLFRSVSSEGDLTLAAYSVWAIHFLIGFAAIFCTFAYLQYRSALQPLAAQAHNAPVPGTLLLAHFAAFAAFLFCSAGLTDANSGKLLFFVWLLTGAATLLLAATACLPLRLWILAFRSTGFLALYAAASAALAATAVAQSWRFWLPLSGLTFSLVELLLRPFLSDMVVQPENLRIGSTKFTAIVTGSCSGIEGVALLLIFLTLWLLLFRKEIRFPQALLLVPAGLVTLLLLNAVRIAALVLIGHAGFRDVAKQGFHSQAGWIVFNTVAFGISVGARRMPWILKAPALVSPKKVHVDSDAVSAYLLPFLAILLGGMLARAASGNFEWAYGLRLLCAVVPLYLFRRKYASLTWSWDWMALAAGAAVFVLWIALDRVLSSGAATTPQPAALAEAPATIRAGWIGVRAFTAVAVVPFAEELAFRGYLMRRFLREDFESVNPHAVGWIAIAASSAIFGILHGSRGIAGAAAGLCYAAIYKKSGKLSSAVLAHGCTNLLLAIYILVFHDWNFW